jgi:hypothetical protein
MMQKLLSPANFLRAGFALSLLVISGCGAMNSSSNNRVLESMTVSPASADAQNYANGQVTFTATGTFSKPPSPAMVPVPFVAPYSGSWVVSDPNIAAIDQNGMAKCMPGATGTVTVTAQVSANSAGMGAMSVAVLAKAMLTCP